MIGQFKKVRRISKRPDLILEAIKASDVVQVNADDTMIKRANPLPRDPVEALTRTIVIENLPPKSDEQSIKLMCEVVGQFQKRGGGVGKSIVELFRAFPFAGVRRH